MRSTFASWLEKGGRGQVIKKQQQQQEDEKEWLKEKEINLEKLSFTTFFFSFLFSSLVLKRRLVFHPRPIDYLLFVFLSFAGGREGWGKGEGKAAVPGLEKNRSLLLLIAIHQLNVIVSTRSCESSQA